MSRPSWSDQQTDSSGNEGEVRIREEREEANNRSRERNTGKEGRGGQNREEREGVNKDQ